MPERLPSRSGAANPREPKHGTLSEYNNHRCRCVECRRARADYQLVKRAEARRAREAGES